MRKIAERARRAPSASSTSASAAQSSSPEIEPLPGQRMHRVRGIAEQHRMRPHVVDRVLQPQRIARHRRGELGARPAPRRWPPSPPRRTPRHRAPASGRPRPRTMLQTIDERPSGSGRNASGPVGRKRCQAVFSCGSLGARHAPPAHPGGRRVPRRRCRAAPRRPRLRAVRADQQRQRAARVRRRGAMRACDIVHAMARDPGLDDHGAQRRRPPRGRTTAERAHRR